jgi:Flp pilus assembly pilin Flp
MRRFRPRQEGASAVEFALVLPILLLLIFGIIAFGWGFVRWVALTNGAREGARYMAIHSAGDPNAGTEAESRALQWAGIACGDGCAVDAGPSCGGADENATFTIEMPEFSVPTPFFDLTFPMSSQAVMQCGG